MKLGLIVFGAGSWNWKVGAKRLQKEGMESGLFEVVHRYQWQKIKKLFSPKEIQFIKSNARGFGYWMWKPKIISQAFLDFPELDYILYLDAGCELNINPESIGTFKKYCEILEKNQYLAFPLPHREDNWTKRELLEYLDISKDDAESNQIQAGVFFVSRSFSAKFCADWSEIMQAKNFSLLDDSPSTGTESPMFKEHRHDQSIFSLLLKQCEVQSFIYEQQLFFPPEWKSAHQYPIWVRGNRTRSKVNDTTVKARIWRRLDYNASRVISGMNRIRKILIKEKSIHEAMKLKQMQTMKDL